MLTTIEIEELAEDIYSRWSLVNPEVRRGTRGVGLIVLEILF